MLIARIKKETNIAEYILYMWQVEDIIRSFNFNINKIQKEIVDKFEQPDKVKAEITNWYRNLILEMKDQNIQKFGHLNSLLKIIDELNVLHKKLLTTIQDRKYQKFYDDAKPALDELIKRSNGDFRNEIHAGLNGLYGLLLLRLKGQKISQQTTVAMELIGKLLAHLALQYNRMRMGQLNLPEEKRN